MQEIPERFWSLFRSVNRSTYIEALLKINEEYEYSNYFLSREMCIQLLSSYFAQKRCVIWQDELEEEEDQLEPPATRVLNWLLKTGWLRKVDDYSAMTVNIVILFKKRQPRWYWTFRYCHCKYEEIKQISSGSASQHGHLFWKPAGTERLCPAVKRPFRRLCPGDRQ